MASASSDSKAARWGSPASRCPQLTIHRMHCAEIPKSALRYNSSAVASSFSEDTVPANSSRLLLMASKGSSRLGDSFASHLQLDY